MKNWLYRLSLKSKHSCCQLKKWLFELFNLCKAFALNLQTSCSHCKLQILCMNVLIRFKKQLSVLCPWLFDLFHLYTVTLKFSFSTYELVVKVVECRWYVFLFQLRLKKWLSALCPHNVFLSLFAMNERCGCVRCMKTLAIIRIEMVVLVVQSKGIFLFS